MRMTQTDNKNIENSRSLLDDRPIEINGEGREKKDWLPKSYV